MDEASLYQISISTLLVGWFIALILVWVRYDRLKHGKLLLTAILLWPLMLTDEWLKLSQMHDGLSFLIGTTQFVPVIIAATLLLSIRQLTIKKYANNGMLFFIPALLLAAGQWPLLMLPEETKIAFLYSPPAGDILTNWPYIAPYLFGAFVMLSYAVHSAEYLSSYHFYLSDQVVDIDMYQFRIANNGCYVLIFVAMLNLLILGLVIFNWQPFSQWQQVLNISNAGALLFLMLILLEKRRISPTPFTEAEFDKNAFTEEQLRATLKQAEQAIIKYKAYKRKGLRIEQVCHVAELNPAALALATRFILKRNFRAFIYHYRLEYAKKVLMRTDQKVTSVAKRLGFNSEKYLSNMFIKYIHMMSRKEQQKPNQP
ncbi:helix-turn-helix transcriptional regulator [Aliiglaciecola litoralis]|uniref:HTH araC/xylS-type domain-containing protein n=1 Tax=Aliiglaciecola litoralis TaxID=582857 RepID=A0ABP3WNV9_9ALTE